MPADTNNGFNDMNNSDDDDDKNQDIIAVYQQKYGLKPDEEDKVPYDPNAGTLTNIGRFVLNNIAKDPGFGGALPIGGTIKAGESISIPLIERLMGKTGAQAAETAPRVFGDTAETAATRGAADVTADMAQGGMANATDVGKTQQALSRAVDMQQRLEKQKALRKLGSIINK